VRGFEVFVRKEAVEIVRTWRIWVLPGMLLFFALTGPLTAKYTPQIIASVGGSQLAGLVKGLPAPTYLDSYGQWAKNLTQIALFAVIIIYGGLVSAESKAGTAILVLTKPVSRVAFVVAKAAVHSAFLAVTVAAGTLITWVVTRATFGTSPGGALWSSAMAWLAFGVLFIAVMTLLSTVLGSQAGAAGIGLGVFALMSVAGIWQPLAKYSPAGLAGLPATLAAGKASAILWPVVTALALAVLLVAAAAMVFRTKEL
jgi:ABC-2 type transport system permease protein